MCCIKCLSSKLSRGSYGRSISAGRFEQTPEHEDHIVAPMLEPAVKEAWQISAAQIEVVEDKAGRKLSISNAFCNKVYYAVLHNNDDDDGKVAVIKKEPSWGSRNYFLDEVSFQSSSKHDNVIELVGFCLEGSLHVLAYKFTSTGSLHDVLYGKRGVEGAQPCPALSWARRLKIAVGAARGLQWLHEHNIIHCNIKSSNILLFDDDVAKITKFDVRNQQGHAEAASLSDQHQLLGSFGYEDPNLTTSEKYTRESDVYSFGIVLLELLTGRKPNDMTLPREQKSLVRWVMAVGQQNVREYIDPRLKGEYDGNCNAVAKMAAVASECTIYEACRRPTMRSVVERLQSLTRPRRASHTYKFFF